MLGWFKKDKLKALRRDYQAKLEEARNVLRNGDVVRNAALVAEAEELAAQIEQAEADAGAGRA